jgi:folate-dependent phosphoribosylglycinamide formyltransferase PurN
MSAPERLAVFASGGGSNLQAILDAAREDGFGAEVVAVVCNVAGADPRRTRARGGGGRFKKDTCAPEKRS